MKKKTALISGAIALVVVLGGAGTLIAVNLDRDGRLVGSELASASSAALAEVGAGTVTSAERSDDGGPAFNLEVRLNSGGEVDVDLDETYRVVWVSDVDASEGGYVPDAAQPGARASTLPAPAVPAPAVSAPAATDAAGTADRARAEAAALAHVGSGTVTEFDRSDDRDHVYEVEVTLADGRDVDVELDANFAVVRSS